MAAEVVATGNVVDTVGTVVSNCRNGCEKYATSSSSLIIT